MYFYDNKFITMTRFTASILLFLLGFNAYAQIVPAELTDFDKLRNMDGLFVVKIGSVFSDTPKEEQDKLYDLTEVIAIANPDKTVDFVFEEGFEIFEQADSVKKIFINKGFSNVKIGLVYIDDYNVKIILNDSDKETYTISLGSFDKNLPQNEIDKILSLPNVKSLELQNPKRTVYVTGIYDDKIAAKEVVLVLISQGISAEVLRFDKGSLSEIDPSKLYTAEEQESIKNHKLNPIAFKTDKVIYRVQIASSSKKVNLAKFKGMNISFNAFADQGKRVKEVEIGGKPLDYGKTYRICACERDGDPLDMLCRMRGVSNASNTPFTLHSVLKEYLKLNSPVTPEPPLSAKVLDAPQKLLTQVTGVDYQFR